MDPIFSQQIQMPAPKPKSGGMFGGNTGNILAAALAGFVSRQNPLPLQMLMQAQQQKQKTAQEEAQYQRRRMDENADWQTRQQWTRDNPAAPQPTEYERMLQAAGYQPGTPEYLQHVKSYVDMKENPPYYFTDPTTGRLMSMPRNGGGAAGAPAAPGVTFTPIDDGGPSQGGSGGFPFGGY